LSQLVTELEATLVEFLKTTEPFKDTPIFKIRSFSKGFGELLNDEIDEKTGTFQYAVKQIDNHITTVKDKTIEEFSCSDCDEKDSEIEELEEKIEELQEAIEYNGERLVWCPSHQAFIGEMSRRCYKLTEEHTLQIPGNLG
jgi:hypothetical protein